MIPFSLILSALKNLRQLGVWKKLFSKKEVFFPLLLIIPLTLILLVSCSGNNSKSKKITNLIQVQSKLEMEISELRSSLSACSDNIEKQNKKIMQQIAERDRLSKALRDTADTIDGLHEELRKQLGDMPKSPKTCDGAFKWMLEQAKTL